MAPLLHSCVEVREPIKLSFGMVSGVGQALMYGVHVVQGEGVDFAVVWPSGFNGQIFERNVFELCVKH